MRYFFFGTLRDPEMRACVLGRVAAAVPARLSGYRLVRAHLERFPLLVAAPGGRVRGDVVAGVGAEEDARIRFYESVEYAPRPVRVTTPAGPVTARAFFAESVLPATEAAWDFTAWQARDKKDELAATELWMALYGVIGVAEAERLWDACVAEGGSLADLVARIRALPRRAAGG